MLPANTTIVIPAYRAEKTIARTIESILAQQGCDASIIVVVDARLDDTADIVAAYQNPRIGLVVNDENRGSQYSRNLGLSLVESDFVMFLDADDYVEGPLLAGLAAALTKEGADVAFGPMKMVLESTGSIEREFVPDYASAEDLFSRWFGYGRAQSARSDFVAPCSVLWRADFLRGIGGWDPDIERNQDGELVARAILMGARIALSQTGFGVYIKNLSGSISSRTDNLRALFKVVDKILALPTAVISHESKVKACALHNYSIAWRSLELEQEDVAREALRRARALGFRGNWGSPRLRLVADLFGLPARFRLGRVYAPYAARVRTVLGLKR